MGKGRRNGSRRKRDDKAPLDGSDKPNFSEEKDGGVRSGSGEVYGDEKDVGLPATFTDGESTFDTCYMCGKEGVEAYGSTTQGAFLCSGACSQAHDECRSLPPEEKAKYRETYKKDPEIKKRIQKELDEARYQGDRARDAGFGGFPRR